MTKRLPQKCKYRTPDGIPFELERKRVRNINLRVRADWSVYVSAPYHVTIARIEAFVSSKQAWIAQQQRIVREYQQASQHNWMDGETLSVWGVPLAIHVVELAASRGGSVSQEGDALVLSVPQQWIGTDEKSRAYRARLVEKWCKDELIAAATPLVEQYEKRMGVHVTKVRTRRMKTRWGSCKVQSGVITLNTELVERPPQCLESVLVHELCHLLEPSHNGRFYALLDQFYPSWREAQSVLKERPPR